MSEGKSGGGYPGYLPVWGANSDFNKNSFIVSQLLMLTRTVTLVQVQSCTNEGGVSPIGTVDVLPLVKLMDGTGGTFSHGTLHKLPYARVQGGRSAVIIDPQPGDIGVAVFADRDISSVKATQAEANPGSRRHHNLADGIYLFTVLGKDEPGTPEQYVRFYSDGIVIHDKSDNKIEMLEAGIKINGVLFDRDKNVSAVKDLTSTGDAKLGGGGQFVKLADGSNATKVKAT